MKRGLVLGAIDIRGDGFIPSTISVNQATWHKYRERLEGVLLKHSSLFPGFRRGSVDFDNFGTRTEGNVIEDEWRCVWKFNVSGLQGQVVKHPLQNWENFDSYAPPDPNAGIVHEGGGMSEWNAIEASVDRAKAEGKVVSVGMPHGFFFQRLYYLRGFENLMKDFHTESGRLLDLIDLLTDYHLSVVRRLLRLGVDMIVFGDDLGLQDRMTISRGIFREFILPSYSKIFGKVRGADVRVYLHSDGHVLEIADDLIEVGVSVLNVQDRVNGVESIERALKGRVCVDLDVDRQFLLPFGAPKDIESHVRNAVTLLGSEKGGLMFTAGVYPDVPIRNVEALCRAFEKHRHYHRPT